MDLAVPIREKNMIFACHTIAHGTDLRRSPLATLSSQYCMKQAAK